MNPQAINFNQLSQAPSESNSINCSKQNKRQNSMVKNEQINGDRLKNLHEISDEVMESVYAYAYEFYNQGRLDEAEKFFRFLCIYDLNNADYSLGLAAVYQMKKEYLKAIDIYSMAYALSENDYRPIFYGGQCYLHLNNFERAKSCFELVLQSADDQTLRSRAEVYIKMVDESLVTVN